MAIWDPIAERLAFAKKLTPTELKKLGNRRLSDVVLKEVTKSRERLAKLEKTYPSASAREKAQRLIDSKKGIASVVGGVSGVFGLVSVPADLLWMTWLQLILLVDVATLYKVNLKTEGARGELLDLFGMLNGIGPLQRSGPKVLGKLSAVLLEKGGLKLFGKAVPLIAAPISAYLNHQHIQEVGEEAIRHYEGLEKAHQKAERRGGRAGEH
jgi:hypothetical protein